MFFFLLLYFFTSCHTLSPYPLGLFCYMWDWKTNQQWLQLLKATQTPTNAHTHMHTLAHTVHTLSPPEVKEWDLKDKLAVVQIWSIGLDLSVKENNPPEHIYIILYGAAGTENWSIINPPPPPPGHLSPRRGWWMGLHLSIKQMLTFFVLCTEPDGAPQNLQVVAVTRTSIRASWQVIKL